MINIIVGKFGENEVAKSEFNSKQTSYPGYSFSCQTKQLPKLPKTHQRKPQQQLKKQFWIYLVGNKSNSLLHIQCIPQKPQQQLKKLF